MNNQTQRKMDGERAGPDAAFDAWLPAFRKANHREWSHVSPYSPPAGGPVMDALAQFQRRWRWAVILCLAVLIFANLAFPADRPPEDPPATNSLPAVCLDSNSVVMPCPLQGDINGDGLVNVGDLVVLQRLLIHGE